MANTQRQGKSNTTSKAQQFYRTPIAHSLALAAAMALSANTTAQETRVLEEVMVTAQKLSESSQNVPISLSLVSAEQLSEVNIFDFAETAELTPGVDLNAGLQAAAIRIRGVGPDFFGINAPQSVAVFVDQVAQAQIGAVFSTLVDVQRLELLRGPQGTLYGQNAPGGVYNITTRAPNSQEMEGYVEATYSMFDGDSDLATKDVRGAINIPLVEDKLAWRLAGVYRDADGFITMENPLATDDTTGGSEAESLRSKVLWNITSDLDLTWIVNYQDLKDYRAQFNYDGLVPGTGGSNPVPAIYNEFEDRNHFGNRRSEVEGEVRDTSVHLAWDAGWSHLDFLASYQEFDNISDDNRNPYFGGESQFVLDLSYEATTMELRLSDSGDFMDYVAGLYYIDRPTTGITDITLGSIAVQGESAEESTTYSAFGNFNFHLSEQWDLALGLRYDVNDVEIDSNIGFLTFLSEIEDDNTFEHVSWSAKLRWYLDDNTTVYAALDNAFKQGGYNSLVAAATRFPNRFPVIAAVAEQSIEFDEETSTAFEIGIKGTALDDRLRYAAAVFYQEFDDHQVAHSGPSALAPFDGLFTGVITNAEEVTTRGVEFDFTYLIGEHWEISNRTAYFDAEAGEWSERFCVDGESDDPQQIFCPINDQPLNNLPQWNVNTQLGYQNTFGEWELYSRLNWTWQSEANFTTVTDEFDEDKSRLGFTLGMRSTELGLDVRLWGKNLTDEDFNIDPAEQVNVGDPTQPSAWRGRYYAGREIGVTVGYSF
jgi:iron complex outermembrane receptor protein